MSLTFSKLNSKGLGLIRALKKGEKRNNKWISDLSNQFRPLNVLEIFTD